MYVKHILYEFSLKDINVMYSIYKIVYNFISFLGDSRLKNWYLYLKFSSWNLKSCLQIILQRKDDLTENVVCLYTQDWIQLIKQFFFKNYIDLF